MKNKVDKILEQRGSRYGDFIDNAAISCNAKSVIHGGCDGGPISAIQCDLASEYIDNLCQKISRFLCEDIRYEDTIQDIIGYSKVYLKFVTERTYLDIDDTFAVQFFEEQIVTKSSQDKVEWLEQNTAWLGDLHNVLVSSDTLEHLANGMITISEELSAIMFPEKIAVVSKELDNAKVLVSSLTKTLETLTTILLVEREIDE